jgi:hypothetical protein
MVNSCEGRALAFIRGCRITIAERWLERRTFQVTVELRRIERCCLKEVRWRYSRQLDNSVRRG